MFTRDFLSEIAFRPRHSCANCHSYRNGKTNFEPKAPSAREIWNSEVMWVFKIEIFRNKFPLVFSLLVFQRHGNRCLRGSEVCCSQAIDAFFCLLGTSSESPDISGLPFFELGLGSKQMGQVEQKTSQVSVVNRFNSCLKLFVWLLKQ